MVQILGRYWEATPAAVAAISGARYTAAQVPGDWFPGDAPLPATEERG